MIGSRRILSSHTNFTRAVRCVGSFKDVKIEDRSAAWLPFRGKEAAKKPVKIRLEAGKTYKYCTCGLSRDQPWCDGSDEVDGWTQLRPLSFTVEKTDDYVLCNCKQTEKRPLCDGAHKFLSPRDLDDEKRTRFYAVDDNKAVYEGVAKELGYKIKGTGYQ